MAISVERKAQLDALIQNSGAAPQGQGLSADRRIYLDSLVAQSTQPTTTQPRVFQSFVQGIAKPFIRTVAAIPALAEGTAKLVGGDVGGAQEAFTKERSFGPLGTTRPIGVGDTGEALIGSPEKAGQFVKQVGGTGLEIGSYLVPGAIGAGSKAVGAAGKVAPTLTSLGKAGALSGALGSVGSELQKEDSTIASTLAAGATGGILGGALGVGLPAASRAAGKAISGVGGVGSEVLGRTTGAGKGAIREAFSNPDVIKFARKAGKEGPEALLDDALNSAYQALDKMTSSNSAAYREAMNRINASPQDMAGVLSDIRFRVVQDATDGFGVRFAEGGKLNNLDFNASDIVEGAPSVQRAFDRMFGEPVNTIAAMDRLKKSLGRIAKGTPHGSPAQALIYRMKDAVDQALKERVPGYAKEMARFGDAASIADDIEKALSLNDSVQKDTAIRKLMSTMRQNNEFRMSMLQALQQSGGSDITGKIAGATLAVKTPRGLAGTLAPTATTLGGLSAVINISTLPILMLYLAASSPRLVAEALALLAKAKGAKIIPPAVQQGLRNLMIRAASEATSSHEASPQDDPQKSTVKPR